MPKYSASFIHSMFLLVAFSAIAHVQGSRLIYHNEGSLPNELDTMELFIGEPVPLPRQQSAVMKRSDITLEKDKQAAGGLWFGPRLGRRRRDVSRQRRSIDGEMPWAVMSFAGGKREGTGKTTYSPRLGRTAEEDDLVLNFMEPMIYDAMLQAASSGGGGGGGPHERESNNNNFSPRLGRIAPLPPPTH